MKAIILAAGRGSRMKKLTDDTPKCLLPVNGKSLLIYQIEALKEAGIEEIAIVTGYQSDKIEKAVCQAPGIVFYHNGQWMTTNMVSSLFCADDFLSRNDCIISYADILYSSDTVKKLISSCDDIAISYDENWEEIWAARFGDPLVDAESFRIKDSQLIEIGKKPASLDDIQGQYMGLLKFTSRGWEQIKRAFRDLSLNMATIDMTGLLNQLVSAGVYIGVIPNSQDWFEFDTDKDLDVYMKN